MGSCDGGLPRAGVHQVANESFGVFDVEATCLVEVPLVSGGPTSWPRFMSASPVVLDRRPRDQAAEVGRFEKLGARGGDVGQGSDATRIVMTDPDGNEFCMLRAATPQ
jgi:hypothetical protein